MDICLPGQEAGTQHRSQQRHKRNRMQQDRTKKNRGTVHLGKKRVCTQVQDACAELINCTLQEEWTHKGTRMPRPAQGKDAANSDTNHVTRSHDAAANLKNALGAHNMPHLPCACVHRVTWSHSAMCGLDPKAAASSPAATASQTLSTWQRRGVIIQGRTWPLAATAGHALHARPAGAGRIVRYK